MFDHTSQHVTEVDDFFLKYLQKVRCRPRITCNVVTASVCVLEQDDNGASPGTGGGVQDSWHLSSKIS